MEAQNPRMVWGRKDLKDKLIPAPCHGCGDGTALADSRAPTQLLTSPKNWGRKGSRKLMGWDKMGKSPITVTG